MPPRAEDELRTRARQQAAAADLGQRALRGLDLEELLDAASRVVARELGVEFVSILQLMPDGQAFAVRAGHGWPAGTVDDALLPVSPDTLHGHTLLSEQPVLCQDFATDQRFALSTVQRAAGVVSAMAVPIVGRDHAIGVMAAHSREAGHFSQEDAHFLQTVANTVAVGVQGERTESLLRDVDERREAEQALRESEQRFRELADTAPVMIWTTDAGGKVTFVNQGWLRYTGTTLREELGDTWTLGVHPEDADGVLSSWIDALAGREPWEREYRLRSRDGEYRWIVDRGVPRFEGGELIGYVGTAIDIHQRKSMEESLRRVYEREHRIAETLQRSLLPERLPEIEGVELAARYLPAGKGAAVGGDWYDAMELPDGRVALVVGDVVGHGLRAAAVMGQLRTAFRAYALIESSPAEILARLNRLMMSSGDQGMATVMHLVLDRDTGQVVFTSAGHPPPLVVGPDGARFLEAGRSVPVGAADPAVFREGRDTIPAGSTLLLYTDGLVERRDTPIEDSLAQLAAAATAAGGELQDVCDQVLAGVLGRREPTDDVALLAVRLAATAVLGLQLVLPAAPEALVLLRRRLVRLLQAAGAAEDEVYEITLTISEAAGNAIEHAYGPGDATFEVEARLEDGELLAAVRDSGRWRERRGVHRGRGLKIMQGLMDGVEVSTEKGGTVVRMRRRLGARVPA